MAAAQTTGVIGLPWSRSTRSFRSGLQTAFVTKALVGLFGSDIFRLAMSPDGSAFNDAVRADTDSGLVTLPSNPKFSAFLNFGQTYTAGAWRDLLFNNARHNDQLAAAIAGNVLTFTAPADGIYMFGLGATYEDTGGSAPTKMQVGLSVNGAAPAGDAIGTAGDAAISCPSIPRRSRTTATTSPTTAPSTRPTGECATSSAS